MKVPELYVRCLREFYDKSSLDPVFFCNRFRNEKKQKLCVKTVPMGRSGKSIVRTRSNKRTSMTTLLTKKHLMPTQTLKLLLVIAVARNISNLCKWLKIRPVLIKTRL